MSSQGQPPPGQSPPGQPPPQWGPQQPQHPYGYPPPPPYGYGAPPPQTEGMAITALVLAIASFVLCPIIPAVVALALAPSAARNIAASGGTKTGEGLVTGAKIVAWINIGLYGLIGVILGIVAIVAGITAETTDDFSLLVSLFS